MNLVSHASEQQLLKLAGYGPVLIQTSMGDDAVRCYVVLKTSSRPDCYSFKLNDNSRLLDLLRLKRTFLVSVLSEARLFDAMLSLDNSDIKLEILQQIKQVPLISEQCCPRT